MEHICGTSRIAGFRFSLYPMTDDFISVIKSALKKQIHPRFGRKPTISARCYADRLIMYSMLQKPFTFMQQTANNTSS